MKVFQGASLRATLNVSNGPVDNVCDVGRVRNADFVHAEVARGCWG